MTDVQPARCDTTAWDGMPLNPERDGDHWIRVDQHLPRAWWWCATCQHYTVAGREDSLTAADMVCDGMVYLGPCALPSDLAAAVEAERESCAETVRRTRDNSDLGGFPDGAEYDQGWITGREALRNRACRDIRARSTGPSALAEHTARVRRDALAEAMDAAHNAVHDAIYEMTECERVKTAVLDALSALLTEADDVERC